MTPAASRAVEVLVVGAGVSGAVVAKRLAEAGVSVLCLEQGDWPDRTAYPGASPEWELVAAGQWSGDPLVRKAPGDYPLDLSGSDFGVLNFNGVGGGSVLYAAQWPRMLADDFRVHSVDGVAEDWPIGYEDLRPFYEATDRAFGVSGLGGNPAYPPGPDPPLPALPIGDAGMRIARAHAKLGWHWWPEPNAIASVGYEGRNPCVQRGTCTSGCNEGAKASTDLTHWPKVLAHGGQLVTGATVRRIVVDRRGLACGVDWTDRDGHMHHQPADVVVLAANAVGTARLLLASADARHPDGLANSSGLVGRNLMLHPLASVTGVFDEPLRGWRAHAGGLVQCLEFAGSDPGRGFLRGAKWALGTAGGPLRTAFAPDGEGRWGPGHHRHVRSRFGHTASWVIIAEDLPAPGNRVELSRTVLDETGMPAPSIRYRLEGNTERLLQWHAERASESLVEAGARLTEVTRHRANGHLMGTARMGTNPTTSVVDSYGVTHDIPNLVVVDGSIFVTAGSVNPTSTIAALALRAAEHLLAARHEIPRPAHRRGFASPSRPTPSTPAQQRATGSPVRSPAPERRSLLRKLADRLIPATDGMPSASDVGVADHLVDRVLRARPDLAPRLDAALAALASQDPTTSASTGTGSLGEARRVVRYVVAASYYLDAGVRDALGYHPDAPAPVHSLDYPEYVEEGLLDHLFDRPASDDGRHPTSTGGT